MAWIEPKTDWNTAYETSNEDMNRIEGNTEDLDTRLDNSVLTATGAVQGVGGENNVSFGSITAGGSILPTLASTGTYALPLLGSYIIPRGIWNITWTSDYIVLQVYINGSWRDIAQGCVISDGVNVRMHCPSAYFTGSFWWQKY